MPSICTIPWERVKLVVLGLAELVSSDKVQRLCRFLRERGIRINYRSCTSIDTCRREVATAGVGEWLEPEANWLTIRECGRPLAQIKVISKRCGVPYGGILLVSYQWEEALAVSAAGVNVVVRSCGETPPDSVPANVWCANDLLELIPEQ